MDYLQENSFFIPSPSPSPQDIGTPAHDNQRTQDLDYLGNYILSAQYPEHRALAEQTHGTDPYVNAPEEERKCFVGRKACGVILGNDQTPDMYFRQQNLPIPDGADTREKMYMAVYDHLDSTVKQAKQKQVEEQKTLEQYGQQLMERIDRACKGTGEQWTPKDVELMNRAGISPDIINRVRNGYAKLPTDFYYVNDEEAARVMLAAGLNKDNLTAEDKKVESILMSLWGQSAYQRYGSTLDRQFDNPVGQFIANQLKPIDNFMMKGEKGLRTFFGNTAALHGDRRTDFTDAFIQHGKGIPFETAQPRYGMKTPPQADRGQIRTINFRAKMKNTMAAAEQAYDEQRSPDYLSGFTSAIGDIVGQSLPAAFPYFGTIGMLASSETQRYEQGVALGLTEEENRKRASLYGSADTVEEKVGMALLGRVPVLGTLINKGIRKTGLRHNSLRAKYLSSQTAQIWGNTVAGVVEEGIAEPIVGGTTRALMSLALNDERGKSSLSNIPGDILQNFQGYHGLAHGLALLAYSRGYVKLAEPQIRENVKHFSESLDGFKSLGGSESGYLRALEIKDTDTRNQYISDHLKSEWANNPEQATRRAEQGNAALLDKQEIASLRELESFRALQERGVIPRFEPAQETGKYRVYLTPESKESTESRETNPQTTSQPDGESKISQTEQATHQEQSYTLMTEDQLNTLLTLSIGERERSTILWAQNLLAAENTLDYLEQQGWKTENIGQTETTATLRTLARQATATVRILEATGITRQESLQSINPDISEHGTLQSIISSYSASKGRLDTARRRGETNSFASNAYVIRQQDPVNGGFQQVLRYSRGETTVENIWEEIMEQAAINWCTQENIPITAFGSQLQDIQRAVNDIYGEEGGIQFIGLDSAPSSGDIVEALSLMGRSRLMHDVVSGNSQLPSWIQNLIRYLSNFLESFRAKVELGHAIAKLEASGNVAQEIRNLINTMTGAVDAIHAQDIRQQSDIVTAIGESIAEHEASFARAHTTQTKTLEDIRAELDSIAAQRDQPEEVPQGDASQCAFDTAKEAAVEASVRTKNTHFEDIVGDMMQEGLVNLPAGLTLKTPSQIGADIGINAAPSLMNDLQSGVITENDAYTITQLTKYPAVQQWASDQIKQGETINNIIPGIQLRDIAAMENRVWEEAELGHLANYINACKQELEQSDADPKRVAEAKVAYNNIAAHHEIIDAGSAWMEGLPLNSLETVAQPETGVQSPASPDLVRDSQGIQFAASLEKAQDEMSGTTFSISPREDQQWKSSLNNYLANGAQGRIERAKPIKMSSAPSVLQALEYSNRDLVITPAVLDKIMGDKHDLSRSQVEQLAAAIHSPVLIVDSATEADAIVVLTEIKTSRGNVMAAIHIDKNTTQGVYHVVASAYDKNSPWMFIDQIKAGKLRYLDKKKALVWARSGRLQLPSVASHKGKAKVLTPEDVVKWENDQRQSGEVHFSITVNGGQIDLRKAHAVDAKGNKLDKDTYITTPNGSLDWFNFPQDKRTQDILKKKGVKNLPIRLRVGRHKDVHNGFGWIHTLNHFDDMADKGRSPLEHLYNTIRNFTGLYKEGGNRHAFKGEPSFNEGSMLIVELQENEGSYSVISSYPTEKNRRPKGNELLIGRALFRFSPNSAANPFGVAQPSIKAVMAGVSATGKARTSQVQQIPPSVNIYDVDVVDQSGKFIYKEVPKPGINFSLAQASVISKLVLAPRANEARARSLMRGMDEAMNRWNIAASSDITHDGAARSFGELNSLLAEIQRVLPDKYKINMRPYLNFGAAYARMLETGRIRSYGKLTSEEKTALAEELQSLMDSPETHAAIYGDVSDQITLRQEVAGRGGLEYAQAYRRQEADIVRQLAEGRLNTLLTSLMTDVRGQLEQYLKDESVAKVLDRVARLMPKKKDNGKYGKGSLPADAYRVLGQYVAMLDADAAAVDGEVVKLQNLIQDAALNQTEAVEGETLTFPYGYAGRKETLTLDQLESKLADWRTFGDLNSMNLDETRAAMEAIMTYIQTNRTAWAHKNQQEAWQNEKLAYDISTSIRQHTTVDEQAVRDANENAASSRIEWARAWFSGLQSFSQMLESLKTIDGMKELADFGIDEISKANVSLNTRENNHAAAFAQIIRENTGLPTKHDVQKWILDSKLTRDTGAITSPVREKTVTLDIQTAQEYIDLIEADDREGFEAKRQSIMDKAKQQGIRPERLGLISERDIPALMAELAAHPRASKISITSSIPDKKGTSRPLRLSKAQAMYQILLYEQDRYKPNFEKHGYTPQTMEDLYRYVGSDGISIAYGLRDYINQCGEELANVFEKLTGVPFPKEEKYFRAKFNHHEGDAKTAVIGESGNTFGHKYSMLITRKKHNLGLDLSADVFTVANAGLAEADNYICTKHITSKFRGVLSHGYAADALKVNMGAQRYRQLVTWLDLIDGAGTLEAAQLMAHSKFVGRMQGAKANALLAYNLLTCIKQTSAILHPLASGKIGLGELMKEYSLMLSGNSHFTFGDMMQTDAFQSRFRKEPVIREILNYGADQHFGYGKRIAMTGMISLEKMDVWSNAFSHAALANAVFRKLEKENTTRARNGEQTMTTEDMEQIALDEVRQSLELAAQPMRTAQKSQLQAMGGTFVRLWTFMGSEAINKFGNLVTFAQKGQWGKLTAAWASLSLWEQTMVSLWMLLMNPPGDDDKDKEKFWKTQAIALPSAMLGSVPVVGATIQTALQTFGLAPYYANYGSQIIPAGTAVSKIKKATKKKATWQDTFNASLAALQCLAIGGGIFSDSRSKPIAETTSALIGLSATANIPKVAVKATEEPRKKRR